MFEKMCSNSSTNIPPFLKQRADIFSSAFKTGFISSRYRGTPPVTDNNLNFSYAEILLNLSPQNRPQSFSGNSSKVRVNDTLPKNPVLLKMFSSTQALADPQMIKIKCEFFLNF